MSSLVSSSIYSQNNNNNTNNNNNNLKPSLSTSTQFQTPQQQHQQQQQLLSHSFNGSYYTPSPLSLPSLPTLINPQQQQQQPQNSPPKSFPVTCDLKTSSTSALALMATTTVSTPTIATSTTTTTISIQQANTQSQQHNRALSEPRFQQPTTTTTTISKIQKPKEHQIETYDNITVENEQTIETTTADDVDADKHIYGILENKEQSVNKNESTTDESEDMNGVECGDQNLKLKVMQKQLFDLTNMIHKALLNGDLKQLASIEYNLNKKQTSTKSLQSGSEESNSYKKTLNGLLIKIKELKVEYQGVKKLQENFSLNINESMKQFVNKLQVIKINEYPLKLLNYSLVVI